MKRLPTLRAAVTALAMVGISTSALHAQRGRDRDRDRDQGTFDTTLTVRAAARLSVSNQNGTVTVRSWGRNQIRVQAEYDQARIEIDESGSRVSVRAVHRRGHGEVDYTITVPGGTAIDVNGLSTDIDVSGVCGELTSSVVSGDITVQCTEGLAQIQTVSGDVSVSDARGDVDVGTTSGDIRVRGVRGRANIHAVSADVDIADIQGNDVTAEVVSGDILYVGPIRDNGRYTFKSHSGEVTVRVVGPLNATVNVSTFSGEFDTDYEVRLEPGTRISREWQFRAGTGSARVRLESFSGTIYLKPAGGGRREE